MTQQPTSRTEVYHYDPETGYATATGETVNFTTIEHHADFPANKVQNTPRPLTRWERIRWALLRR